MNQFGDAYKKLEALGDRERVLAVWPDMNVYLNRIMNRWMWWRDSEPSKVSDHFETAAEAWADAASRLPVVAEPAAGVQHCDGDHPEPNCGAKDCWHNDPPQPAKPEALVSDKVLEQYSDYGGKNLVNMLATELIAWRAWAKNGGSR
jgi:hypothetical protein